MSSHLPPKQYSHEELRKMHKEEADHIGWRLVVNAGQVKGDLIVAILPPVHLVSNRTQARSYHYRHDMLTGKYYLVQKTT